MLPHSLFLNNDHWAVVYQDHLKARCYNEGRHGISVWGIPF